MAKTRFSLFRNNKVTPPRAPSTFVWLWLCALNCELSRTGIAVVLIAWGSLRSWVLRMIYMLVSKEEEVPWPTPFIQQDWCVACDM